jgi:hypothetical protein
MNAGLDALDAKSDPATAISEFRKGFEKTPTHYGANVHVAMALDRAGKQTEARPQWKRS